MKTPTQDISQLTTNNRKSLDERKEGLMNSLVLAPTHATRRYTIDTDGCGTQVACLLLQKQAEYPDKPIVTGTGKLQIARRY